MENLRMHSLKTEQDLEKIWEEECAANPWQDIGEKARIVGFSGVSRLHRSAEKAYPGFGEFIAETLLNLSLQDLNFIPSNEQAVAFSIEDVYTMIQEENDAITHTLQHAIPQHMIWFIIPAVFCWVVYEPRWSQALRSKLFN